MLSARRASVLAVLALAPAARGHVAPSLDTNNRYAKIVLLPREVRVVYTVFFGERPGAGERRRMDRNGDGAIDEREAARFGVDLLGEVGPRLTVELDGRAQTAWRVADVGLGSPVTRAGALSVDLELRVPLAGPGGGAHTLRFDDRWQVPAAGEGETRVEESPGVHAEDSFLVASGARHGLELRFAFTGNPAAGDRELSVRFTVDPEAATPEPAVPPKDPRPRRGVLGALLAIGAAGVAAAACAIALALRRRRGRKSAT